MNPNPMMPPPQRPGWWSRNWKWFVPVSLVSLLVFGGLVIALIFTVVMGSIKGSVPYTRAMAQAKSDPALVAELGTPIEAGWFVTGSISTSSGSGSHADLSIPISGPKGSGTLHVVALKSPFAAETNDWKITVLEAKVDGRSEVINLNEKNTPAPIGMTPDDSAGPKFVPYVPRETVGPGSGQGVPGGVPGGVAENGESSRPPAGLRGPVSGGVLNGKAIHLPKPPYPAAAKAVAAKGPVIVQVTLDENGHVITAKAMAGHPLLRAAAEAAAREARFTPTKLSGQAVKVSGVITYNFTQ